MQLNLTKLALQLPVSMRNIFIWLNLLVSTNCFSQTVDSLLKCLDVAKSSREIILLHVAIADKLASTNPNEAIAHCESALKSVKVIGNDSLKAVCFKCLINAYYNKPYFEDSALYFIPLYEKEIASNNFSKLNYETFSIIADVYLKKHDYLNATHWCQLLIENAAKTRQPDVIGYAKSKLGEMYRKAANYEESRRVFEEVVALGKKENLQWFIFSGYRGIGISYDITTNFDRQQ